MDIERIAKEMSVETIRLALLDIKKYKKSNSPEKKHLADSAIAWFNERSQKPFGYGWCLVHSNINPNAVRSVIKSEMES